MFGMGMFEMVLLVGAFSLPLVIATVLAVRFVRTNEQRVGAPRGTAALEERIARLEQLIEQMSVDLERVAEGQRFTTQVLAGRGEPPESPK